MRYRINHLTEYAYSEPVTLSHHQVHVVPLQGSGQTCQARDLRITPQPALRREHIDTFGNRASYFSIEEPHRKLVIEAYSEVTVAAPERPPLLFGLPWETVRDRLRRDRRADVLDAYAFSFDSPFVKTSSAVLAYAEPSFPPGRALLDGARDLTHRIHSDFTYDPVATTVATPLSEVIEHRRGVCQDFAHLQIACLRALGLAGRYVSGYLLTRPPPGTARLVGADASHAWVSTYLPDFGWVEFDPTNDLIPGDEHITLAYGRDFGDVTPVRGVILGGGAHELRVVVDVAPAVE